MGVVSNGMLCSGEELRLTADGDGILILPGRHAARGAARGPLRRRRARRGRQAQPRRRAVDPGARPRGRRGDRAAGPVARTSGSRRGAARRRPSAWPSTCAIPTCAPRFVGRWVSGVTVGPSPDRVQMRLLAAGQRPICNVVDASNYVMLELGKPIHTFDAGAVHRGPDGRATIVVRRALAGRAARDARPRRARAHAATCCSSPTRRRRSASPASWAARPPRSRDATTDVAIESAIFDPVSIRRTAQRLALRSEASSRFEKGQEPRLARIGADRTAQLDPRVGGRRDRPGRGRHRARRAAGRRGSRSGPRAINRLLGTELSADEQRDLLARVGVETEPAPGEPVHGRAAPETADRRSRSTDRRGTRHARRDRAHLAPRHRHRGGRRRGDRPRPRLRAGAVGHARHRDAGVPPLAARGARAHPRDARRRRPDRGRDDRARVAAPRRDRSSWRATCRPSATSRSRAASRSRVTQPALARPLGAAHEPARQPARRRRRRTFATARDDVAVFEIGKGYARSGDEPREWWRLGFALVGAGGAAGLEPPGAAVRPRRREGPARAARCTGSTSARPVYAPESGEAVFHPGRTARAEIAGPPARARRRAPPVDSSTPGSSGPATRVIVARGRDRGPRRGAARARARAGRRAPPGGRTRPRDRRRRGDARGDGRGGDPRAAAASCCATSRLFDIYRGVPLAGDEKSLAFRLRFGRRADAHRGGGRGRRRGDRGRPAGGRRAAARLT